MTAGTDAAVRLDSVEDAVQAMLTPVPPMPPRDPN